MSKPAALCWCMVLLAAVPMALAEAVQGGEPELTSVQAWSASFDAVWPSESPVYEAMSVDGNSWHFYSLEYPIDGLTRMYEATGRRIYLDRALFLVSNMIASAQPSTAIQHSQYHDRYRGWAAWDHPSGTIHGGEYSLYESICWRYVSRLLRVIRERPELFGDQEYRSQYERILEFTRLNIWRKWFARDSRENVYRANTHMTSHWAYIAMELSRLVEDRGERAEYRQVFENFNRHMPNYPGCSLRGQLQIRHDSGGAYFWNPNWGSFEQPGQDNGHSNGEISYIVEAVDLREDWTSTDVSRLISLATRVVWPSAGVYRLYVGTSQVEWGGWMDDGYEKLGAFDRQFQHRLDGRVRPADATLPYPRTTPLQAYGVAALNRAKLDGLGGEP